MTEETYRKANNLMGKITTRKGYITTLTQRLGKTNDVIKKDEIEKKIIENMAKLANLKKEFKLL